MDNCIHFTLTYKNYKEFIMNASIFSKIVALLLISMMLLTAVGCDMASIFGDMMIDEGNGINQADTSELGKYTGIGKETESTSRETAEAPTEIAGEETDVCLPEDTAEPEFSLPIGELDFEGKDISILCTLQQDTPNEWKFTATEDQVDAVITKVNQKVMNDLNLSMSTTTITYNGNYTDYTSRVIEMITQDVVAAINEFEISSNYATATAAPSIRDYAANLLDEDLFPYLDFSLPCWNASFVKNNTVRGRLHYVVGDIGTSNIDSAVVMWHNEDLYNMHREDGDPENLQELVLEGGWTYDVLNDWTKRLYFDLDGLAGITPDDSFALIAPAQNSYYRNAFASAWDLRFVEDNGTGTHSLCVDTAALQTALNNFNTLFSNYGTSTKSTVTNFANGNSLFYIGRLDEGYKNGSILKESEIMNTASCSLLPLPKFSINQESYKTALVDDHTLLLVLKHDNPDGEAISAFLQYSAELWNQHFKPYYVDSHILLKNLTHTGDQHARTQVILKDILDNIDYDYENVYSPQLSNVTNLWTQAITSGQNISSLYRSNELNYMAAISDTDTWFKS